MFKIGSDVVKTSMDEVKAVFGDYTPAGLETVLENKENAVSEVLDKEDAFVALLNEDGFAIDLMNGETILGGNLTKLNGFKLLCKILADDYTAFDDKLFSKKTLAYGEKKTVTNYEYVTVILQRFGIKEPQTKSKVALKNYRNIFWTARRHYKLIQLDEPEIKYLKDLVDINREKNTFDETLIEDYLDKDDTNLDLFGMD